MWQAHLVTSAPDRVVIEPVGLAAVSWVATTLAMPVMMPLIYAANDLGYDPFRDNVYWLFPVLNSVVVGLLVAIAHRWYIRQRGRQNEA